MPGTHASTSALDRQQWHGGLLAHAILVFCLAGLAAGCATTSHRLLEKQTGRSDSGLWNASIMATGFGMSQAEARSDALRSALEQRVEQLAFADRRIEGDQIVRDRVLTTLNGRIVGFEVLDHKVHSDGQHEVRAHVRLGKGSLPNYLPGQSIHESLGNHTRLPLEGLTRDVSSIRAEQERKRHQAATASQLAAETFAGFPAFTIDSRLEGVTTRAAIRGAHIEFRTTHRLDNEFVDFLRSRLAMSQALLRDNGRSPVNLGNGGPSQRPGWTLCLVAPPSRQTLSRLGGLAMYAAMFAAPVAGYAAATVLYNRQGPSPLDSERWGSHECFVIPADASGGETQAQLEAASGSARLVLATAHFRGSELVSCRHERLPAEKLVHLFRPQDTRRFGSTVVVLEQRAHAHRVRVDGVWLTEAQINRVVPFVALETRQGWWLDLSMSIPISSPADLCEQYLAQRPGMTWH